MNSVDFLSIFLRFSSIFHVRLGSLTTLRRNDCLRIYGGIDNTTLAHNIKASISHFVPHALINTFMPIAINNVIDILNRKPKVLRTLVKIKHMLFGMPKDK